MIVSVDNLTHRYPSRTALSGLSFTVEEGSVFGLLGPNGGGKSTLFRILATLMSPTEGCVTVAGFDVGRQPGEVRRHIGVVFQSQSLDKKLTVEENLRAQGHLHALSGTELSRRIQDVSYRLGLDGRGPDLVETLSGGLRRRVEIAKALLHRPRVLLMDEPSTGLDPGARRELSQYMAELRDENGVTILLTTHILDEAEHCGHLLLLHEGRRVAEGSPGELRSRLGGDVVILESSRPEQLAPLLTERFGVTPLVVDSTLRMEIGNGHRFIAEIADAFPGEIESMAVHKPTLEDVFLRETGAKL